MEHFAKQCTKNPAQIISQMLAKCSTVRKSVRTIHPKASEQHGKWRMLQKSVRKMQRKASKHPGA